VLEPEAGTLIVLAGLATVDRLVGETVLAGERLGDLGGPIPESDEFLLTTATDRDAIRSQSLYIELRRAGEPVNPALWFNFAMQGIDG
jgi:septal ring factor EnvC (AmiA/AmiB activator)